MRRLLPIALVLALADCAGPKPRPTPPPPPPAAAALPAAPPQQDWRDVPLTPGAWSWRGGAGRSLAQFGLLGAPAIFALSCDASHRTINLSRAGSTGGAATMLFTTSFGAFPLAASDGAGEPPAIVARAAASDPHLDQIAFSRGRFLVDVAGAERLVLPAWPEVARVIEDCRS
ncbi:hypothetical protein [Sphingomonas sp.]|uniref:hypothetical protein n=1 Tax=Sphingomonas sp. TaxID=28214 RepID=UPI003B00FE5B